MGKRLHSSQDTHSPAAHLNRALQMWRHLPLAGCGFSPPTASRLTLVYSLPTPYSSSASPFSSHFTQFSPAHLKHHVRWEMRPLGSIPLIHLPNLMPKLGGLSGVRFTCKNGDLASHLLPYLSLSTPSFFLCLALSLPSVTLLFLPVYLKPCHSYFLSSGQN